jgi:hypothetical protein
VQLVTIAPDTRATMPNPYRPKAEAKPDAPIAPPAPKPEPKPEPPIRSAEPPPSAVAQPSPPPPEMKPEAKPTPAPPPPPPKPVEAMAPPPPPLPRPPEAKPQPEIKQVHHMPHPEPVKKPDPAAFDKLVKNLENKKAPPASFDALLKNLSKHPTAETDDLTPPREQKLASTAAPSSQPKAPLGSQLTASDLDLVREQLRPCFNPPFGAKDNPNMVADIRVAMNQDGTVQQTRIVDMGHYGSDPVFRALADSGVRALRNPQCAPLRLPPEKFDQWKSFIFGVSTKDMQ